MTCNQTFSVGLQIFTFLYTELDIVLRWCVMHINLFSERMTVKLQHALLVSIAALVLSVSSQARERGARGGELQACKGDVEQFCQGVKPGEGRIAACLKEHKSEVSAECKDAIKDAREHRTDRKKDDGASK